MNKIVSEKLAAYQYNIQCVDQIDTLCSPLKKYFGISHFWYNRFYPGGQMIELTNQLSWKESFWQKDFPSSASYIKKVCQNLNDYNSSIFLTNMDKNLESILFQFKMGNIFNIFVKRESFLDVYAFAADRESQNISSLYSKHPETLIKFGEYFQEKSEDLIMGHEKEKVHFGECFGEEVAPPSVEGFSKEIYQKTSEPTLKNKILLDFSLTKQEKECLFFLSQGKTSKEIARCVGGKEYSYRTVEFHILNIRNKLGGLSKSELAQLARGAFYK